MANMEERHKKIDEEILNSISTVETPASARAIAKKAGVAVAQVCRRFVSLGFEFVDGRWVKPDKWRHNGGHEDE